MDDMNAFDRQLAKGLGRMAGPGRQIDAVAMARTAATPSPKWRLQSMFSATKFVVAGVIVALFGGFLLAGVMTTQPSDEVAPAIGASASPSPETTYAVTDISAAGFHGHRSVATDEALWVLGNAGVSRIDRATSEVTGVPASDRPRWLVASADAIWAVDTYGVERIDRTDLTMGEPITRDRGQPFMWQDDCHPPIIADGSLWIASPGSESHSLVEIDLATRSIRDEYVAQDDWSLDHCGPWMGVIGDAIWIYSKPDGSGYRLTRFDLGTREFTDRIDDLPGALTRKCCVVDDDAIWLMDERSVSRFDLATYEVTDTVDVGRDLSGGIAAAGAIWVVDRSMDSSDDGVVYRIDTSTTEVTDVIDVGQSPEPPAFLQGAIWVANHHRPWSVSRIDVESRLVTDTVPIPVRWPHRPLASENVIWVYTQDAKVLRIDPAAASD